MIKLVNSKGAEKTLPRTILLRDVPLAIDVPIQPLHGLDGGVKTGPSKLLPRQIELKGYMYYPDKERIRQEFDALMLFLAYAPVKVYKDDRYLTAHLLGAPQSWRAEGADLELSLSMIALDPLWYGEQVVEKFGGTKTVAVDGTALAVPIITTTAAVSSLTVTNQTTGQQVALSGPSGIYRVDNDGLNPTVKVGGTNRLDLANNDWLLNGFNLTPGANQITTNQEINLVYRPRWY